MNRRESLKAIGIGSLSASLVIDACKPASTEKVKPVADLEKAGADRLPVEAERDRRLQSETFFTPHEMATLTVLADIIIPADEHSGSASDAKVPDFIEFIVKDKPEHQTPMRGGLRWLDMQSLRRYEKSFVDASKAQQLELVDAIAFPETAKPDMKPGVAFFDSMRSLTATGFFTSKMGVEDLGYAGNKPNKWEGVPEDIVKQYGLQDVRFDSRVALVPYKVSGVS